MLGLQLKQLSLALQLLLREAMLPLLFDPGHVLLHLHCGLLQAVSDLFDLLTLSLELLPGLSLHLLHVSDLHLELSLDSVQVLLLVSLQLLPVLCETVHYRLLV